MQCEPEARRSSVAESLSEGEIRQFIEFFTTLDRWEREAHGNQAM
jgi:hypothetical protein